MQTQEQGMDEGTSTDEGSQRVVLVEMKMLDEDEARPYLEIAESRQAVIAFLLPALKAAVDSSAVPAPSPMHLPERLRFLALGPLAAALEFVSDNRPIDARLDKLRQAGSQLRRVLLGGDFTKAEIFEASGDGPAAAAAIAKTWLTLLASHGLQSMGEHVTAEDVASIAFDEDFLPTDALSPRRVFVALVERLYGVKSAVALATLRHARMHADFPRDGIKALQAEIDSQRKALHAND